MPPPPAGLSNHTDINKPVKLEKAPTLGATLPAFKGLETDTFTASGVDATAVPTGLRSGGSPSLIGGGVGGNWTRLGAHVIENGKLIRVGDITKIRTPESPVDFVKEVATFCLAQTEQKGDVPPLFASGFPGQFNRDGVVTLAANLPGYQNFKLVDELRKAIGYESHEETRHFKPSFGNDITMQLRGIQQDKQTAVAVVLGTGAGNGGDRVGRGNPFDAIGFEGGHAPYTTRGMYPQETTYEQALCNFPAMLQHHIKQTLDDPKAAQDLVTAAREAQQSFKNDKPTLEDWKRLHEAKHPIAQQVLEIWKETTLPNFTQSLILSSVPDPNKQLVAHFGGTVAESYLNNAESLVTLRKEILKNPVVKTMYPNLTVESFNAEEAEVTGAARTVYNAGTSQIKFLLPS